MKNKPFDFIELPIYSIASTSDRILFSGGGGHGITNRILVFQKNNLKKEAHVVDTGSDIIENMVVQQKHGLLACSAGRHIIVYRINKNASQLKQILRFVCDSSVKNAQIVSCSLNENTLCWRMSEPVLASGGDDCIVRVYEIKNRQTLLYENMDHLGGIKHVEFSTKKTELISVDRQKIVISNYESKEIVRRIFSWNMEPVGCQIQAAQQKSIQSSFIENEEELFTVSYVPKRQTFVGRTHSNMKEFDIQVSIGDQCCKTAKCDEYVAVASGNGTVQIHKAYNLEKAGMSKRHDSVIMGLSFLQGGQVVSGTSSCSYHIQNVQKERSYTFLIFAAVCLILLFVQDIGQL